jgi:hypothetical protein
LQLTSPWRLRGLDFSSAPSRRKPCVLAEGHLQFKPQGLPQLHLQALRTLPTLQAYAQTLDEPGPWLGAFDLPFSLPRELVLELGWPTTWPALIEHYARLQRPQIRDTFATFCAGRPAGRKFAHRRCDGPAGSSPSMKWVNPPVAYMLHAGVPPLLAAGCSVPGLHSGDQQRMVLEAYPGLLARQIVGRSPYKSDAVAKQDPSRRTARVAIVQQLQAGWPAWRTQLVGPNTLLTQLVDDAMGDSLDAVLCLVAAAWAAQQPDWGRPSDSDPLEGWIVGAEPPPAAPG